MFDRNFKSLIVAALAALIGLLYPAASFAGDDDKKENITITVSENGGNVEIVNLEKKLLNDPDYLRDKLSDLDIDMQDRVIKIVQNREEIVELESLGDEFPRSVQVLRLQAEELEANSARLEELLGAEELSGAKIQLKRIFGKRSAESIAKSIESGEFTYEQLDLIQAALDAKR